MTKDYIKHRFSWLYVTWSWGKNIPLNIYFVLYKIVLPLMSQFSGRVTLHLGSPISLLEVSVPGDISERHSIFISISVSLVSFLFFLSDLSMCMVSKKSRHLGFCLDWAVQLQSASLGKLGPSRGFWLVANEVRGGSDVTQKIGHSHWLWPG